jgi:diguanylate cyclase (GGDEF)-like protein
VAAQGPLLLGTVETATWLAPAEVEAALPLLDAAPDPVLWVGPDYAVRWRNRAAVAAYGDAARTCHQLSHGYPVPCDRHGELCPKREAEARGRAVSVGHVHAATGNALSSFRVTAIPVAGGGVVEYHIPIDDLTARDPLTGLWSRGFFEQLARRQLALMNRLCTPYAVALLDLDHFKRLNDSYGHAAGDEALRAAGAAIERALRTSDAAGRWGGEEFCLILPGLDIDDAADVLERVRAAIAASSVEVTVEGGGMRAVSVTVSAGLVIGDDGYDLDRLVARADAALYQAKRQGRDRVVIDVGE